MDASDQSNEIAKSSGGLLKKLSSLFHTPDEQAMWRVQNHDDSEAFALLLNRWEQPIKRLCTRMVHDEHKAEDLTQETFARIYTKRKDYQHGGKFSTFLWRVAMNACLDELRRVKRRREFSLVDSSDGEEANQPWDKLASSDKSPEELLVADERAIMVQRAVQQLPEHYRAVVVLRHYQDLKFREVADVLDIPIGTVKSRMAESLQMLNQILTRMSKPVPTPPFNHNPRFPTESLVL